MFQIRRAGVLFLVSCLIGVAHAHEISFISSKDIKTAVRAALAGSCEIALVAVARPPAKLVRLLGQGPPQVSVETILRIYDAVPLSARIAARGNVPDENLIRTYTEFLPASREDLVRMYIEVTAVENLVKGFSENPVVRAFPREERIYLAGRSRWATFVQRTFLSNLANTTSVLRRAADLKLREISLAHMFTTELYALLEHYSFTIPDYFIDQIMDVHLNVPNSQRTCPLYEAAQCGLGVDWPTGTNPIARLTALEWWGFTAAESSPHADAQPSSLFNLNAGWSQLHHLLRELNLPDGTIVYELYPRVNRLGLLVAQSHQNLIYRAGTGVPESPANEFFVLPYFFKNNQPGAYLFPEEKEIFEAMIDRVRKGFKFYGVALLGSNLEKALSEYALSHPGTITVSYIQKYAPFALINFGN